MKKSLFVLLILVVFFMAACDMFGSNNAGFIYEAMKSTTPVISEGVAKTLSNQVGSKTLTSANPNYSIYYIFQDYVYPDDEGVVDSGNLYKLLFESSKIFTDRKGQAQLKTPSSLPFNFDNPNRAYDHAFNSVKEQGGNYDYTLAYRIDGDNTYAYYGYTVRETYNGALKTQRQAYETTLNEVSGDLTLDFCTFDDKGSNSFGSRAFVSGNSLTHTFFIQFSNSNSSIVGKGVSKGDGYFILCKTMGLTRTYYKLPAGATEGNFEAVVGVTDITLLDDPLSYAKDIEDYIASSEFIKRATVPTSLVSFSNDGLVTLP